MGVRISLPVQKEKLYTMSKIGTYFAETRNELVNKVSWPTWPELQSSAIVVMISSVIIALVVFGMDFVFEILMKNAYDIIK
jgi:preprotein translocase subunit SecE